MTIQERDKRIRKRYFKRIMHIFECIREAAYTKRATCGEIKDMTVEEVGNWGMAVYPQGHDKAESRAVFVDFIIEDGVEEGAKGRGNFRIRLQRWGGGVINDWMPHNYTASCWVSLHDTRALTERFNELESAVPEVIEVLCDALDDEIKRGQLKEEEDEGPEHRFQEGQKAVLVRSKIPTGHGGDLGMGIQFTRKDLKARTPVKILDQRHDGAGQLCYLVEVDTTTGPNLIVLEAWLES